MIAGVSEPLMLPDSRRTAAWQRFQSTTASPSLPLLAALAIGLLLRLALAPFGDFQLSTMNQRQWAETLTAQPVRGFFAASFATGHLPGDLWILWLLAHAARLASPGADFQGAGFLLLLKAVPMLADVAIGATLFLIARRAVSPRAGALAASLYLFNPGAIFLASIWGDWTAAGTCLALVAVGLTVRADEPFALPVLTCAALIDPVFIWLAPLVVISFWKRRVGPILASGPAADSPSPGMRTVALHGAAGVAGAIAVALAASLPFNVGVWPFSAQFSLLHMTEGATGGLPFTTVRAFNFWSIRDGSSGGGFRLDAERLAGGLTSHTIGWTMFLVVYGAILIGAWRWWNNRALLWAAFATLYAVYMLPTEVHDSSLLSAVAFGAVLAAFTPRARWLFAGTSIVFFLNLYWAYALYSPAPELPLLNTRAAIVALSLANAFLFLGTLAVGWLEVARVGAPVTLARLRERGATLGNKLFSAPATAATPALAGSIQLQAAFTSTNPVNRAVTASQPIATMTTRDRVRDLRLMKALLPIVLVAAAFVLYVVRLDSAHSYSFDEVYHAYTAAQYVEGNADAYVWYTTVPEPKPNPNVGYEWTHPPVGKWLIAAGIWAFGDKTVGWRIASAVFGAIGVGALYFLGFWATGRRSVGVLAAVFLMADGLYFVQSRTGMVDIFLTVFMIGALAAFLAYMRAPLDRSRRPLFLTGALMGLGIATKWNGFYAAGLIGLAAAVHLAMLWNASTAIKGKRAQAERMRAIRTQAGWIALALIAVPAGIYLLSYGPFFLKGHSFAQFRELQRQMYEYHAHLKATHAYSSVWWEWPLARRPVWYYGGGENGLIHDVYANVNPFLAWLMVPSALWLAWRWKRWGGPATLVIMIGFFGQWLPWVFSPRLSFAYHFLASVPFGALAVAVAIDAVWRRGGIGWRATGWPAISCRVIAGGAVVAIIGAFIFFYPIYSASALTQDQFNLRMWFASWR